MVKRTRHADDVETFVELILRENLLFFAEFADRLARLERFFRELRGHFVTDIGVQTGDDRKALFDGGSAFFRVRLEVFEALVGEDSRAAGEDAHGVERDVRHDGHENIELELTAGDAGESDRRVVAEDFCAELHEAFADDRVDLAGHDGASGLEVFEDDLIVSAAGAGAEPTDVVGDVGHGGRDGFEERVTGDEAVALRVRFEVVLRFDEGDAGLFGEERGDRRAVFRVAVNAASDGGSARGEFADFFDRVVGAFDGEFELTREAAELLTERHGGRVGEVGASDLNDVFPFFGFGLENVAAFFERGDQLVLNAERDGDVDRGRERVVRGLTAVDVVVRVNFLLEGEAVVSGDFERAIGDDLVRVHIRGGSGAGLIDVDGEFRVELAVGDFLGGLFKGVDFLIAQRRATFGEASELRVCRRGAEFDETERVDKLRRDRSARNWEIIDGALSLSAIIRVFRQSDFAHRVTFDTNFSH